MLIISFRRAAPGFSLMPNISISIAFMLPRCSDDDVDTKMPADATPLMILMPLSGH